MDDLTLFGDRRGQLRAQAMDVIDWLAEHRPARAPPQRRRADVVPQTFRIPRLPRSPAPSDEVARRTVRRMRGRLKSAVRTAGAKTPTQRAEVAQALRAQVRSLVF
ncbi:MAG: hypothetical protein R3F65_17670 [bacterium]